MASTEQAAVLLLDLPDKALAGIDLLSFTTNPRFQGVKTLPAGWHFVFTSANSALSIRHGAWFCVPSNNQDVVNLHVIKWNRSEEELVSVTEASDIDSHRPDLNYLLRDRLTPYRQSLPHETGQSLSREQSKFDIEDDEGISDWSRLTSHLSKEVLNRVLGNSESHWTLTTASAAQRDVDAIPGLTGQESSMWQHKELNVLPIDLKRTWREGATGRERTEAARDRTWALRNAAKTFCPVNGIRDALGELQFCFIMVLTLNNYSCLEQWKRLLELFLTSFEIIHDNPQIYVSLLETLLLQLQHCQDAEGGLFDLSDQGAMLLKNILRRFSRGTKAAGVPEEVTREYVILEDYLKREHDWHFDNSYLKHGLVELEDGERVELDLEDDDEDEETGEYAPVVVDMPDQAMSDVSFALPSRGKPTIDSGQRAIDEGEEEHDIDEMDERY